MEESKIITALFLSFVQSQHTRKIFDENVPMYATCKHKARNQNTKVGGETPSSL